jgi:integrase
MAKTFTDRGVQALKPRAKRYEVMDSGPGSVRGLGIRVSEDGRKVGVLIKRLKRPDGTVSSPVRLSLGEYPATSLAGLRAKAIEWSNLIARGIDPREERKRIEEERRLAEVRQQANTFAAVSDRLFASHRFKAQRRGHVVARIVRKELLPTLGPRSIAEITSGDIKEIVRRTVNRGKLRFAHSILDCATAVFNYAVDDEEIIDTNPCKIKRERIIGPKNQRKRVLSDSELRAMARAADRLRYPYGPFYRLLMLTGVRRDEASGARWGEFNLDAKMWTIPAVRFKSDRPHIVPLSDDAVALLRAIPRFTSDYLFVGQVGAVNSFAKAKDRLDRYMLLTLRALARQRGDNPRTVQLEPFVNHDIRRTVRTRLSALKVPDHVAELVIGHGRQGLAAIYDQHAYVDEMREALDRWALSLRTIVNPPTTDNVVALRATA